MRIEVRSMFERAMEQMEYAEAIKTLASLIKKFPKDEDYLIFYGTLLDHQALCENILMRMILEFKARRIYKNVLKYNPKSIKALLGLGRIYWHKNSPKSIYYYNAALKLDNNNPEILTSLGNAYKGMRRGEEAEKYYSMAINTNRANFGTYLNFAKFLSEKKDCFRALELIKKVKDDIEHIHGSKNREIAIKAIEYIQKNAPLKYAEQSTNQLRRLIKAILSFFRSTPIDRLDLVPEINILHLWSLLDQWLRKVNCISS